MTNSFRVSGFVIPSSFGLRISSLCRGIRQRHPQLFYQKRPLVRRFLDEFGRRLARAVARARLDPDERGFVGGLRLLQRGGKFKTVRRHYAVVMVRGGDERRRIFYTRLE